MPVHYCLLSNLVKYIMIKILGWESAKFLGRIRIFTKIRRKKRSNPWIAYSCKCYKSHKINNPNLRIQIELRIADLDSGSKNCPKIGRIPDSDCQP